MDRRFLKELTKGYLVDHDVYGEFQESEIETIYETIYNELTNTVDFLYEFDNETYEYVRGLPKLRQHRIFELYLNGMYKKDVVEEQLGQGGAGQPRTPDPHLRRRRDRIPGEPEPVPDLLEQRGPTPVPDRQGDADRSFMAGALALLVGISTLLGIRSIPDPEQVDPEGGGILARIWDYVAHMPASTYVILLLVIYWKRRQISKRVFQIIRYIGAVSEKVGDFLQRKGRFARFRYVVLQENVERCYRRCGITNLSRDINVKDYFNKYAGDSGSANAQCLANCYVEHEVAKVKLVMKMYFVCLRQTGAFDNIKELSTERLTTALMADQNEQQTKRQLDIVGTACVEYFAIIHRSMQSINSMIEYFYSDRQTQQKFIMTIQKDVDEVKRRVSNMNENELRKIT